jgi:predicted Zn-dependent protease
LAFGALPAFAQDSPAYHAGQQLGDLLFRKPDNSVYYNTLTQGLAAQNAMAEAEQHRQEAVALEQLYSVRQALAAAWMKTGMSQEEAAAVAQAFTPSDSDDAVFLSVRGEAPDRVVADIRQALAVRNYQLANQLLIGYLKATAPAK